MKKLIYLCIAMAITSCTKEVQIDIPGYEEQMVVDGIIETGQPAIVLLSVWQTSIHQPIWRPI